MPSQAKTYLRFGGATVVILLLLGYLAYTGVQDSKSYYVTIKELHKMGDGAYSKRLRVAGNVQPGSIQRRGTHVQFVLMEEDQTLHVDYTGTEAPPDTFKDDAEVVLIDREMPGLVAIHLLEDAMRDRIAPRSCCRASARDLRPAVCAGP